MIEVTVPLTVRASLTFHVENYVEVTEQLIMQHINSATRAFDRRGDDESGVYVSIDGEHGEPEFYDPNIENDDTNITLAVLRDALA